MLFKAEADPRLDYLAHGDRLRGLAKYSEVLFSSRPFLVVLAFSEDIVYCLCCSTTTTDAYKQLISGNADL